VDNKSEENLHVQIEYSVTGKQINYAIFAIIVGFFGYSSYSDGDTGEEISRHNQQSILVLQDDVKRIRVDIEAFTTILAKSNRELIEDIE